jgi:hypothetical protein
MAPLAPSVGFAVAAPASAEGKAFCFFMERQSRREAPEGGRAIGARSYP